MTRILLASLIGASLIVASPVHADQADTVSFFGIQTHFGQGRTNLDSLTHLVQLAGFQATRDEVYWSDIETAADSGAFHFWPSHDAYILSALAHGIRPLLILDYGNSLYGGTPRDSVGRAAFARYCKAVVGRYAPMGVRHFEIWNEPNLNIPTAPFWPPGPNAAEYFEVLKVAYAACKSADPSVTVLGCATSPLDEPETSEKIPGDVFIQRVFDLGGAAYMDAVSFHQYPVNQKPEDWLPAHCAHVRTSMGATPRPMWITETGQHTASAPAYGGVSESIQAQYMVRAYLVGRIEPGLERISWYDLIDDCADGTNAECRFGILHQDLSPKPAYQAISAALNLIGDRSVTSSSAAGGAYQVRFGSSGQEVVAVWASTGTAAASVVMPAGFVKVLNMNGTTEAIIQGGVQAIPITASESPQYLVSLPQGPALKEFHVIPHECLFDSSQQMGFNASGLSVEGIPVAFDPTQVTWSYIGTGGVFYSGGFFVATGPGAGTVIGTYGAAADTVPVSIVSHIGSYLLSDCSSYAGWQTVCAKMDTQATAVAVDTTVEFNGTPSFRIAYRFVNDGTSGFTVSLHPPAPIMLPGRADSLLLAVRSNGAFHRLIYTLVDQLGNSFILTPRYINTSSRHWVVYGRSTLPSTSGHDYPFRIRSIDLSLAPLTETTGQVVNDTIYVDHLTAKFNPLTAVEQPLSLLPAQTGLFPNYPNPFNPATVVRYELSHADRVRVLVYDILGREVARLVDAEQPAGRYEVLFEAARIASGTYVCRLQAGTAAASIKMLLLR